MTHSEVVPRGISLRLTEDFLLSRPQVLEASVLWADGCMHAYVTVAEGEEITTKQLQSECMDAIGLHQTPRNLKLMRTYSRRSSQAMAA
ncbi:MAG: hypothetical protein JNJ45_02745 [Chthonomonas sp.]|nr:hypothetical protein [Chthonomonas sp.]